MTDQPISVSADDIQRPGRSDFENQLIGMRELFSSIISQNKREYDVQLNEMKLVFTNILNETRQSFQDQIQRLYLNLPKLIQQKNIPEIPIPSTLEPPPVPVKESVVLDGIREMILGEEISKMRKLLIELQDEAESYRAEGETMLEQLSHEFSTAFQVMEESMMEAIGLLVEKVQSSMIEWDKKVVLRKAVGDIFDQIAKAIK